MIRLAGVFVAAVLAAATPSARNGRDRAAQLLGTWRGTSTCTDRVAAPACQDETVVYVFTAGTSAGVVHWAADKIVNGQREPMGEFDLTYDEAEACWKAEYRSPRMRSVWRVTVDGAHLTGTAHLLPGNAKVRQIEARREAPSKP